MLQGYHQYDDNTAGRLTIALSIIIIEIIIKNLFTVGYNRIVYPRPDKLIHTNYLQKYNILTKIII